MGICQSVCHVGDCSFLFTWWHHFDVAIVTLLSPFIYSLTFNGADAISKSVVATAGVGH